MTLEEVLNTNLDDTGDLDYEEVQKIFNSGVSAYKQGDIHESLFIFDSILAEHPDMLEALINKGNAHFKLLEIDKAIECWQKALDQDPTHIRCYINLGNAYYHEGDLKKAIDCWQKVISLSPDHLNSILNLGVAYENMGELGQAFSYYETYLKYCKKGSSQLEYVRLHKKIGYSKKVAELNAKLGVHYQKYGQYNHAAKAYLKALEYYPNLPKVFLNMGSICYKAAKYDKAISYWLKAARLDSGHSNTYCNLAVAYEKVGKIEKAYCMYKRYLELISPDFEEYSDVKKRAEFLRSKASSNPALFDNILKNAEKLYNNKKFDKALWEYENYLILNPEREPELKKRIDEVKGYLNPIFSAVNAILEIANKCYDNNDLEKAFYAYKRAFEICPEGEVSDKIQKRVNRCARMLCSDKSQKEKDAQ